METLRCTESVSGPVAAAAALVVALGVARLLALVPVRAGRYALRDEHAALGAAAASTGAWPGVVTRRVALREFPLVYRLALELGLFRTFAVPSTSAVLERTGKFSRCAARRYDDTDLLVREYMEPEDGEPGAEARRDAAVARLNAVHATVSPAVDNDDMLYTLSVFLLEPVRWIDAVEWRPLCGAEKAAMHAHWKRYGEKLGIRGVPSSYSAFEEWSRAFERRRMRFAPSNLAAAEPTLELLLSGVPRALRPAARACAEALMDPPLQEAMGYRRRPALRRALLSLARARALFVRHICRPRDVPLRRTEPGKWPSETRTALFSPYVATYPAGYRVDGLGAARPGALAREPPEYT